MRRKKDKSNGITALYERLSRDDDKAALTADFQKEVKPKGDKSIFLRLSRYAFVYRLFCCPKVGYN